MCALLEEMVPRGTLKGNSDCFIFGTLKGACGCLGLPLRYPDSETCSIQSEYKRIIRIIITKIKCVTNSFIILVEENYSESVTIVRRQRFEGGFHFRKKYSKK